ncbi:hypothetical protein RJ641_023220, partial [Dillenia turbinata]
MPLVRLLASVLYHKCSLMGSILEALMTLLKHMKVENWLNFLASLPKMNMKKIFRPYISIDLSMEQGNAGKSVRG